jgi:hypothetical protein
MYFFNEVLVTCNEVRLFGKYLLFYFVTFVIFWRSKKAVSGLEYIYIYMEVFKK